MERRRAVAIAAATVATTLGAAAAVAVNFGLLGFGTADPDPVGLLDAGRAAEVVTTAADPNPVAPNLTVRYEDIYLPAPAAPAPSAVAPPAVTPAAAGAPVTTVAADIGAVTAEDPGAYESGEDHDDDDREGGDDEHHEEEADD